MEPDKLIKKFENAIEDYRIERITSQQFPGSVDDLTALRNMIHPPLTWLKPEWMADPRACGPLALTWTGSLLNGFNIPAVVPTLSEFPARSEEHTSELQSLMRISYAVFCLKKKNYYKMYHTHIS